MLKRNRKKIKSAPKTLIGVGLIFSGVLFYIITAFIPRDTISSVNKLVINQASYQIEVVDTDESRARGLSGRDSLPQDEGMLFVFEHPDIYCFWMKKMQFDIDIIWLDSNKEVVHIAEEVSPDTYPQSFCPNQPAKYVLEVSDKEVQSQNISIGDRADF